MPTKELQHARLLMNQNRFSEAESVLKKSISLDPEAREAKDLLSVCLFELHRIDEAEALLKDLMAEDPSSSQYSRLLAFIKIEQERFDQAEQIARSVLRSDPDDVENYVCLAAALHSGKKYDEAIQVARHGLTIDPNKVAALNILAMAQAAIGDVEEGMESAATALKLEPDNPHAHASVGFQNLREGKAQEALLNFKEALRLDPQFAYAQHGLLEAMKSKYWLYRIFLTTQMKLASQSSSTQWALIIGGYIVYRILLGAAEQNEAVAPFIWPVVGLIAGIFLLTWIIAPLFNFYMLSNPYGRLILDQYEKMAARITGVCLLLAIGSLLLFAWSGETAHILSALAFLLMMVPVSQLGMNPLERRNARNVYWFAVGLITLGVLAVLLAFGSGSTGLLTMYFVGIFIFSWVANAAAIR